MGGRYLGSVTGGCPKAGRLSSEVSLVDYQGSVGSSWHLLHELSTSS